MNKEAQRKKFVRELWRFFASEPSFDSKFFGTVTFNLANGIVKNSQISENVMDEKFENKQNKLKTS